jgi:hypothetical protein
LTRDKDIMKRFFMKTLSRIFSIAHLLQLPVFI